MKGDWSQEQKKEKDTEIFGMERREMLILNAQSASREKPLFWVHGKYGRRERGRYKKDWVSEASS